MIRVFFPRFGVIFAKYFFTSFRCPGDVFNKVPPCTNLETRFVQGGTLLKTSPGHRNEVKKYLAKITPNLGKKTLIITEEIYSGESVSRLLEILKSLGIQADVAAFSMVDLDDGVVEKEVREKFLKQGVD